MIVKTLNNATYALHFQHTEEASPRGPQKTSRVTVCHLHTGPCHQQTRPCVNMAYEGKAFCSPKDHFNRAAGRKLALERALKASGMDKFERTEIWNGYLVNTVLQALPGEAPNRAASAQ